MVKRTVCSKIGELSQRCEKSIVMYELMVEFKNFSEDEQVRMFRK